MVGKTGNTERARKREINGVGLLGKREVGERGEEGKLEIEVFGQSSWSLHHPRLKSGVLFVFPAHLLIS